MRHLRYARYIAVHTWWVFVEGCRLGIPWLAALHDLSKLHPETRAWVEAQLGVY